MAAPGATSEMAAPSRRKISQKAILSRSRAIGRASHKAASSEAASADAIDADAGRLRKGAPPGAARGPGRSATGRRRRRPRSRAGATADGGGGAAQPRRVAGTPARRRRAAARRAGRSRASAGNETISDRPSDIGVEPVAGGGRGASPAASDGRRRAPARPYAGRCAGRARRDRRRRCDSGSRCRSPRS